MMIDSELKEATIQYVKKCYEQNEKIPSLREISRHFRKEKLNFTRFYKVFSGGIPEVCRLAAVPVPMERIVRVERAMKASRMRGKQERDLSEVEDERVRGVLAKALEWEKRRDKAKALVEAEKREKEAKVEALKIEGQLDPKKIPEYLEEIQSPLLSDLRHACALKKISLEDGCVKAVEYQGKTFLESRNTFANFDEYLDSCLTIWMDSVKLEHGRNRYGRTTYRCCCECGAEYEYVKDDCNPVPNTFKCPNNCEGTGRIIYYPCPVCKQVYGEQKLIYDSERNVLRCSFCGSEFRVIPPAMKPRGSKYRDALKKRPEVPKVSLRKIFETLTQE
jgi:hypothetical protein